MSAFYRAKIEHKIILSNCKTYFEFTIKDGDFPRCKSCSVDMLTYLNEIKGHGMSHHMLNGSHIFGQNCIANRLLCS